MSWPLNDKGTVFNGNPSDGLEPSYEEGLLFLFCIVGEIRTLKTRNGFEPYYNPSRFPSPYAGGIIQIQCFTIFIFATVVGFEPTMSWPI